MKEYIREFTLIFTILCAMLVTCNVISCAKVAYFVDRGYVQKSDGSNIVWVKEEKPIIYADPPALD